jgi:protein TonB
MGIMAAPAPFAPREPPGDEEIFHSLVLSNPAPRQGRRALPVSATLHVLIIAAFVLIPLYWSDALPDHPAYLDAIFINLPRAAAAPLPKGREDGATPKQRPKQETPQQPQKIPDFQQPVEVPNDKPPDPTPGLDKQGDPGGSDNGTPDGMKGGVDGGVVGGDPSGVVGGCIWCDGNGTVMNPDEFPRLLTQTKPIYPQDAFVKKVEGTVIVEALVDATGHVANARVVKSIPVLDAAAIAAVRQWIFAPARHHGVPVQTIIRAPIQFRIF